MVKAEVQVVNKTGLHARPASNLAKLAKKYKSKITLFHEDKSGDAKSIIRILTLDLNMGSQISIQAEGEDEEEALADIVQFISSLSE